MPHTPTKTARAHLFHSAVIAEGIIAEMVMAAVMAMLAAGQMPHALRLCGQDFCFMGASRAIPVPQPWLAARLHVGVLR